MILVAGDLMVDVLLLSELRSAEQSRGILLRGGGSAANTASWLAAIGCASTFIGCAGDDPSGAMLIAELQALGVRPLVRSVEGMETGAVAVDVTDLGERVMRSARGANEALAPEDFMRVPPGSLGGVHLTGYSLLGPRGFDLLAAAAECAGQSHAVLSFDPSSTGVIAHTGADRMLMELERRQVALLLPNFPEARALTGADTAVEAAKALAQVVPMVVVKDGVAGAAYSAAGETRPVPTIAVDFIDTTGAGDAFNAGILAALIRGDDLRRACVFAHAVARKAISVYGGRPPVSAQRV